MMVNELSIDERFFANNGVISRRKFIINFSILFFVLSILITPYMIWLINNLTSFVDYLELNKVYFNAPFGVQIWYIAYAAFASVVGISNIKRRLNDILGNTKTWIKVLCSIILVINYCCFFFPLIIEIIFCTLFLIMLVVLASLKGQTTSSLSCDPLKKFNFGAFFGTWIWGLFNKSYKTLWMLLLWFTPFSFYFALYCGFMGNRWAYNSKKEEDDDEKFHKSQKNQSFVFFFLNIIFGSVILPMILSVSAAIYLFNQPANSDIYKKLDEYAKQIEEQTKAMFSSYEISSSQNTFYIEAENWNALNFDAKIKLFDFAAELAVKEKNAKLKKDDYKNRTNKITEANKTKIYETSTKKLIAEFNIDESIPFDDFGEVLKASMKAYKFYNIK